MRAGRASEYGDGLVVKHEMAIRVEPNRVPTAIAEHRELKRAKVLKHTREKERETRKMK